MFELPKNPTYQENAEDDENHYVYIAKKKEGADLISDMHFAGCLEE